MSPFQLWIFFTKKSGVELSVCISLILIFPEPLEGLRSDRRARWWEKRVFVPKQDPAIFVWQIMIRSDPLASSTPRVMVRRLQCNCGEE